MNQGQSAVPNLLGMARTAVEARNDEEAISYFNRVLETDPTVSEAWLGKGRAVARLSSLKHVRIHETAVAFGHAIGTAPEAERPELAAVALTELATFAVSLNGANLQHWDRFADVEGTAEQCAVTSLAIIDALQVGLQWLPNFQPALEVLADTCRDALAYGLSPERDALIRGTLEQVEARLKAIDPSYRMEEEVAAAAARAAVAERTAREAEQKRIEQKAINVVVVIVCIAAIVFLVLFGL